MFIYSSTLMHFCFSGKYNSWDKVDPAELFSKAPTEKKEANPKLTMVKFLQVFLLWNVFEIWNLKSKQNKQNQNKQYVFGF